MRPSVRSSVAGLAGLALLGACSGIDEPSGAPTSAATTSSSSGGSGGTGGSGGKSGSGGFSTSGGGLDECAEGLASCAPHASCIDTPGFYKCACDAGYEGDGKLVCEDVDECQILQHDCAAGATCTNTEGSFTCACPNGLVGDGKTCAPTYLAVATGYFHACALRSDKTLWCWGLNTSGQSGTGLTDAWFTRPASPSGASDWVDVGLGETYSCALTSSGQIFCWGSNTFSVFGDGTTTSKSSPSLGGGGASDWASFEAGRLHVCAIKTNGKGYCWGRNTSSQLGDGTKDNNADGNADNELSPVEIAGGRTWLALSGGNEHSCGVTTNHEIFCWGLNSSYQLGDGTTTERQAPVQVGLANDWASVEAGAATTCAVKMNGERWCWGTNSSGQAGDGTTTTATMPKRVDQDADWLRVSESPDAFGCGTRTDGRIFCWGDGSVGQTAQPTQLAISTTPLQVGIDAGWKDLAVGSRFACGIKASGELACWGSTSRASTGAGFASDRLEPAFVGTDSDWTQVAAHVEFACGLRNTKLFCWGRHVGANLGDGGIGSSVLPVAVDPATDYAAVTVGRQFGCALTVDGAVRCWGSDATGQQGNGMALDTQATPKPIAATPSNSSAWTQLAAGENAVCGVRADNTLWCWGSDSTGQLGNGATTGNQHTPVQVAPAEKADWLSVSTAGDAVCARRGSGTLACWGRGGDGQLGLGTTTNANSPQAVGVASYGLVATGRNHSCAVRTDGSLWCWGRNNSGEIGLGNTVGLALVPTESGASNDWDSLHLGPGFFGCARKKTGSLHCVGFNGSGQLGLSTITNASKWSPLLVPWTWKTAVAGNDMACAIRDDGRLMCWGSSVNAQLGHGVPFLTQPSTVLPPL